MKSFNNVHNLASDCFDLSFFSDFAVVNPSSYGHFNN